MRNYPVRIFSSLRRLAPVSLLLLAACSSGGGGDTPAATTYSIGGSITGLVGTVVLQNNSGDNLTRSANGTFTFTTKLADGAAYSVTVLTQPAGQLCTASSNTGTVAGANVISVAVSCTPISTATYTVGGVVSGLTGTGLELQNNSADTLSGLTVGNFTFSTAVNDGAPYSVSVLTQPTGQSCTVSNGTGNVSGANVTSVTVNCAAITYRVRATVTGLISGGSVQLTNNGIDLTTATLPNQTITFFTALPDGAAYDVTTGTVVGGQTCTASNNTGFISGADVTATVTCSTNTWTVGGTAAGGGGVTGLVGTVVLRNNNTDDLTLTANGDFVFGTSLAQGSDYSVTVATQPANQLCEVVNGSGFDIGVAIAADITDVAVNCVNTYTIGGTISGGADGGGGPTLQNNGGDTLAIAVTNIAGDPFTFDTPIADGSTYSVTQLVRASAPIQDCAVTGGDGTVAGANVTSIVVTCTQTVLVPKFAYVTNSTANSALGVNDTVSAFTIDGTGALADIVGSPYTTDDIPQSLAIDPSGSYAYIANFADDTIMVYSIDASGALARSDANSGALGDQFSIPTGDGPFSLAIHPSGNYAYAVNQFANTISGYTVDATNGGLSIMTDVNSLPTHTGILTGNTPYALTIDPTGRYAYVANYGDDTVSAYTIDQATGTLATAGTVATGTNPSAIAVDPTGACALVANNSSANVSAYAINPDTGVLTAATGSPFTAGTSPRSVAIDPSGQYAYVANAGSANVSGFSLDTLTCVMTAIDTDSANPGATTIAAGTTPVSITVVPSGQFVYVANLFSDDVSVYSIGASGALTWVEDKPTGSGPSSVTVLAQ